MGFLDLPLLLTSPTGVGAGAGDSLTTCEPDDRLLRVVPSDVLPGVVVISAELDMTGICESAFCVAAVAGSD